MEYPSFYFTLFPFVNPHFSSACGKGIDKYLVLSTYVEVFDEISIRTHLL